MRSFVRRDGRLTTAQRDALERLYPRYGVVPDHSPIALAALFGREAPCCLDIGFGNGDTLLWHAANSPDSNFLGIEVYAAGIGRALRAIEAQELTNVRVLQQDAVEALERLPAHGVQRVMLLFPDPWPKKRHHKRRIVNAGFLDQLARVLAPGGVLHMATDWAPYAQVMHEVADAHPAFTAITAPAALADATRRPATRFERRGERLGHAVVDLAYSRR